MLKRIEKGLRGKRAADVRAPAAEREKTHTMLDGGNYSPLTSQKSQMKNLIKIKKAERNVRLALQWQDSVRSQYEADCADQELFMAEQELQAACLQSEPFDWNKDTWLSTKCLQQAKKLDDESFKMRKQSVRNYWYFEKSEELQKAANKWLQRAEKCRETEPTLLEQVQHKQEQLARKQEQVFSPEFFETAAAECAEIFGSVGMMDAGSLTATIKMKGVQDEDEEIRIGMVKLAYRLEKMGIIPKGTKSLPFRISGNTPGEFTLSMSI